MATDELDPIIHRIRQHIHIDGGCWIWTAAVDNRQHPVIWVAGRTERTRRITWQLTHGQLPAGTRLRRTCEQPRCVNPNHMLVILTSTA